MELEAKIPKGPKEKVGEADLGPSCHPGEPQCVWVPLRTWGPWEDPGRPETALALELSGGSASSLLEAVFSLYCEYHQAVLNSDSLFLLKKKIKAPPLFLIIKFTYF